jgi:methylenetetrahydrofolate reductase (NADPH)
MELVRDMGLDRQTHILAGIIPVRASGMARYMQASVPGVAVPQSLIDRMKASEDRGGDDRKQRAEHGRAEGISISLELIEQVRQIPGVHGIHIMAVNWEDIVPVLVEKAGLYPRPRVE